MDGWAAVTAPAQDIDVQDVGDMYVWLAHSALHAWAGASVFLKAEIVAAYSSSRIAGVFQMIIPKPTGHGSD